MRLLIIGGYGTFGGRTVELLQHDPRLTLLVAGRSLDKAKEFCAQCGDTSARLVPARFDRDGDPAAQLAALKPDLVLDASGPFQAYDEGAYRVVEAAIAARIPYLDLADDTDFVAGVRVYDAQARAAGVYVLSGVSTFPVLTSAVVRRLAKGLTRIDEICGGIAPSPFAGVGENVIRAITSYAGQPVAHMGRAGEPMGHPLTQTRRYTIAPPGRLPLHSRLFSLVDVPDARVLPELWPQVRRVWMGAAPVPEILHRGLIALAWGVRLRLFRTLLPLAPLIHWAGNHLIWGEHRGGMFVEVKGAREDGGVETRSWHLLAEGDDGPYIPCMAVQAVVQKALAGTPPRTGARACTEDVELEDYERLFAARAIYTGMRGDRGEDASLYRRVLGEAAWAALPEPVRALHDGLEAAEGVASVERGLNPLAWLAALLARFPPAAAEVPVRVRFERDRAGELWTRTFGGHTFSSRLSAGRGRSKHLLTERFGVFAFAIALVLEGDRLRLVVRRWSILGLSLPLWLAPRSNTYETAEQGVFQFFIEIMHPLCGLIVRYRGWLKGGVGSRQTI